MELGSQRSSRHQGKDYKRKVWFRCFSFADKVCVTLLSFYRFTQLSLESDPNCRYDYIELRDGNDMRSPVIGRFCGDQLPPPMKSSSNLLHILFTSDGYNNFDGFVLTFQESPGRV